MAKTRKAVATAIGKIQPKKVSIQTISKNNSEGISASAKIKTNLKENMKKPEGKPLSDTIALDKTEQKKVTKETKKIKKGLEDGSIKIRPNHKKIKQMTEEKRGLVYIGHVPHGFYEKEMRNYFKQFGRVTNTKVCRSRITGKSKGFGYIEFNHPEVAKIAAETMNNYIMFKKRIVTEFVPHEKRPKNLFQGKSSNEEHTSVMTRRGKQKNSRNKMQDELTVTKKAKRTYKNLQSKVGKLKNLGIQCDLIPVDVSDKVLNEIKLEKGSDTKLSKRLGKRSKSNVSSGAENSTVIKRPSSKRISSKTQLLTVASGDSISKKSPSKSLSVIKSKKAMLTKSLDSVKNLLGKKSIDSQDEETQTPTLRVPKVERLGRRGGITKKKDKNTAATLNSVVIKKIARELIRKKGSPLLNLKQSKPKSAAKKK